MITASLQDVIHCLEMQRHKRKISTNAITPDMWSELSTLLSLCQGKWQTCHLKCMNTLCNTQQRSSSTSWRTYPWGTVIDIHGQSYGPAINYYSHYRMRGQRS